MPKLGPHTRPIGISYRPTLFCCIIFRVHEMFIPHITGHIDEHFLQNAPSSHI